MPHARQQIRAAFATAVTGLTSGATVHVTRAYDVAALPVLLVSTPEEVVERATQNTKAYRRLTILCEAIARVASNPQNSADTLCAEVEVAILGDETLGGLTRFCRLASTSVEVSGEGEQPTVSAAMTFECLYRVDDTDPTVIVT